MYRDEKLPRLPGCGQVSGIVWTLSRPGEIGYRILQLIQAALQRKMVAFGLFHWPFPGGFASLWSTQLQGPMHPYPAKSNAALATPHGRRGREVVGLMLLTCPVLSLQEEARQVHRVKTIASFVQ